MWRMYIKDRPLEHLFIGDILWSDDPQDAYVDISEGYAVEVADADGTPLE